MQQIKPVQTIQPVGQLPAPEKPTNKSIYPVNQTLPVNKQADTGTQYQGQQATMTGNVDQEGFGLLGKAQRYSKNGTEPIYNIGPKNANAVSDAPNPVPPMPGAPQTGGKEGSAWGTPKPTANQTTSPATPASPANDANAQYQVASPPAVQNNYVPSQYQSVTGDAVANAPKANIKDNTFTAKEYQNVGTNGVTSDKQYQYDPRNESLVQNQITGLLDPNSEIMRKAQAQAQGYNAARGLQSSSIGNEVALSSMIDKALPIAQQDAQTYNQAQSQQWQTQAQLDQTNLKNQQDASMADKQGAINNQLQNNQMDWQTGEKNTDRQFQAELEDLKYKQQLGTLDAQGKQRLQELNAQQSWQTGENNVNREFQTQLEDLKYKQQLGTLDKQQSLQLAQMERSAQIQTDRDSILQNYQVQLNDLQNDQRWKELTAQIGSQMEMQVRGFSQQAKMEYGNAQGQAVNAAMQAIGMAMSNPNMTAEQQKAAITNIMGSLQSQANMLAVIYGASDGQLPPTATPPPLVTLPPSSGSTGSTGGSGGGTGTVNPQAKTGTYPGAGYIGGDVGIRQQQK
ncbi:hypothetical protein [Shewanella oncorhynchi]|uniref:hypothetical protein n=1 Tax=Shewanella oncorhynchi TaxID=2726434 RepID=UPI003D7B7914